MEPEITESPDAVDVAGGGIEFRNVSFRYNENSEYALNNIDFSVQEGETVGII
jgi:ATP-binding cassette subfamily B protein